ncbi:MAG: alpha/beta hydrolase [Hyphomonadaceae bacterium]
MDPTDLDHMLDPEMRPIVARMRERMAVRVPMTAITPPEMRERASQDFAVWNIDPPPLPEVRDLMIEGAPAPLRARLYVPEGASTGLLVHFHGGGWIIGDIDFEDRACRSVARESGVKVLSVDYRLAPETLFPGPVEDCARAIRWARANADALGVSADKIAVGGASAGANLALAAALKLRDDGDPPVAFLALLYGVFAMRTETESYRLYGQGQYGLGAAALDFFMAQYLNDAAARSHPYASPLLADLRGLPGAFIVIAGMDPLRDDSRELAAALRAAGAPVEVREYEGVIHGFTQFALASAQGRQALEDTARALKTALAA